jgi:hypothetical protein
MACMEERKNAYKILTEKPLGKRSLWKQRYRWEDNIIIYLRDGGGDEQL